MEDNLDLVRPIAVSVMRRLPASFEYDDLASEGRLGLISAAQKYEPERGVPFRAYASKQIRYAVLESARRRNYTANTHEPIDAKVIELPGSDAEAVEKRVEHGEHARIINEARAALAPKQAKVIEIYFDREAKLKGIGAEFGIRGSRSSQLLQESKRALAQQLEWRGLKAA